MDITFNFNKIYFIVSDSDSNKVIDIYHSLIERKCEQSSLACELIDIEDFGTYQSIINNLASVIKTESILPYIHFECHGSKDGIRFKNDDRLSWEDFGESLSRINVACKNNLFVSMAACYGGYLTLSSLKHIMDKHNQRAPVCGFLGPNDVINYGSLEEGIYYFFDELLTSFDFKKSIAALNTHSNYSPGYTIKTCQFQFREVVENYIRENLSSNFQSKVSFYAKIASVLDLKFRTTGLLANSTDINNLEILLKDKYFYIRFFNEIALKYFMIDLYPENKNRFSLLADIDNWDELLRQVR